MLAPDGLNGAALLLPAAVPTDTARNRLQLSEALAVLLEELQFR